MALLIDRSGSVDSNFVAGNGTQSATFTLPGSLQLYVESVIAAVDNASGSAVQPKVTIRDPAGNVVATVVQARSIPAGDTGNATWALRIGDSQELAGIYYDIANDGGFLNVHANTSIALDADTTVLITADGQLTLGAANILINDRGGTLTITNTSAVNATVGGFNLTADNVHIFAEGGLPDGIEFRGVTIVKLTTIGDVFRVDDHLGAPIFTLTG